MSCRRFTFAIAWSTVVSLGLAFGAASGWGAVPPKVPLKAEPFSLKQVRLLDGPFKHAMELDRKYLLSLDVERLLHCFRASAGLPSPAKPLGGWEEPKSEVRGHSVGHYLSACALMYASTSDETLKTKADRVVAGMAECQAKIGNGYLSAFPEEFIDRVEACKPVWAPWYTIHKIYAGLVDVHVLCDNKQALEVVTKACDWVKARSDKLSDEQMEKMLGNEHGGMNEVLAEVYALTGQEKYLKLAQRFNHHAVLDPLARRQDRLTGLHANTQFPKVLGAGRQYELTGQENLRTVATFFWDVVTKERSYVTGGNSDGEAFSPKERLSKYLGPTTTESCNTYNMLKITRRIFGWDPKAEYADYYERALYNHILASQNPETGMVLYYLPLKTGVAKTFCTPTDSFWCCVGTGIENHAKYGDSIYFHDGDKALFVNLFIPSELAWSERGLRLRQQTRYPDEDRTRLSFACEKPIEMALRIRHPYWAVSGFEVAVNGQAQAISSRPGSYVSLQRTWQSGDTVEVRMPMTLRTEGFRDDPRKLAIFYGPLVLCAEIESGSPVPAIVAGEGSVVSHIRPVAGKPLRAVRGSPDPAPRATEGLQEPQETSGQVVGGVGRPAPSAGPAPSAQPLTFVTSPKVFRVTGSQAGRELTLIPLLRQHKKPYIVYWDVLSEAQWTAKLAEIQAEEARRKALDAQTVDRVMIGEDPSERTHAMVGERTGAGEYGARHWRHAVDGGWFSYEMKVLDGRPMKLLCCYWGSDAGPREFDVLVDGQKIATQKLNNNRPDQFYDEIYPIPAELSRGKAKITVRFQGHPGNMAGGVFDCRVLK